MKKIVIVSIFVIIILLISFLFFRYNRDERIIGKNLRILKLTISKSKDDSNLTLIGKTQKIQSLFTVDCRVVVEYKQIPEINDLNELITVYQQYFRLIDDIKVNFYDISIKMMDDRNSAHVLMTAKATGTDPQNYEKISEVKEVQMIWKKINDKWKITELKALKTLH